jgi:hypothetical protein
VVVDFTAVDQSISVEEVKAALEAQDFLSVKKEYVSKATIKLERVQYAGLRPALPSDTAWLPATHAGVVVSRFR